MKKNLQSFSKVLVLAVAALYCCIGKVSSEQPRERQFGKLKAAFKNPSKEFRSAPLWVWNTKVTNADIDRMLGELKSQGFGGAFVHPRPGLITEYLSDDWFKLYKYSVEAGKKLGMDIWIYDENSYPSGFAGGHVNEQMPESYNQGQGLDYTKVEVLPDNAKDYFLCLKKEGSTFKDITASLADYKNTKGEYYLYKKTYYGRSDWHGGYSYVDLLHPGVTEKFLDITMTGYEKTFGKELGTAIKGVFTDEPNISSPGGIRWTPDLFEVFQKRWGYDLKSVLPLLVETTDNWQQVRHNYTETLTQLFIDRWAKPYHAYCEKKNMKWTGHYWEHGWPDMSHGGDNMAMYVWHQMPAIDMLFNQYNEGHPMAQFGNIRSVKELSSVANQMGYARTLSETYGGGGWNETFEDFKRLGDWEYVLGVNFMNQHLSHMTIVGARKYDYPPVFTSISPWWSSYKTQNDYFARLSLILSQGDQLNDILIIEPTTTAWLTYSYVKGQVRTMDIGIAFQNFITKLEKSQVEYDLGSENIIKDQGSVKKGQFVVGKRGYKRVVLPPITENLNSKTFQLLKKFVKSGGELILFSTPTFIDGKESAELAQFMKDNAGQIKTYNELSEPLIQTVFASPEISFKQVAGNHLYHHRRSYKDGELVFLVNSSLTESATGRVAIKGKTLMELDAMSGTIYAYPCKADGNHVETEFNLPPAGSLILFSSPSGTNTYKVKPEIANGQVVKAVTPLEVKRLKDNVLSIDFCDLIIDGKAEKHLYTVEACNKLYQHYGMNDPWNSAVQFKQQIVEKDTFRTGDIKVLYSFIVADNMDKSKMRLVAEQPDIWKVKVNGKALSVVNGEYWLDSRFGVYSIGDVANTGVNTIELSVKPMSIYAEIAPVYVVGDFSLEPAPMGWVIKEPVKTFKTGSWKGQGQPYYSWDMGYSKTYNIDNLASRYAIQLNKWNGTLAEVYVNNQKAGIIAYKPYNFDLTPYVKKGDNKIEVRVIGSLRNLMGPHYTTEVSITGPWHWNGVQKQAPGNEYYFMDYGLMEDFDVITSK
ncbi:glycosyl hydrolase [Bacteroides sp.]|uniref:glycosyl hydrolase n=1 Tax=Bacteroides sp. TaxID=29523 RepID=UPI002631AAE3|nr:glycosyl hydrolase [Bacteroides sp.]MDD3036554.1 glycosyl hydrolase [Bacteroides sp.]